MATTPPIFDKVTQFVTDADLAHQIVHGPASGNGSVVSTNGGPIPTFAKQRVDLAAELGADAAISEAWTHANNAAASASNADAAADLAFEAFLNAQSARDSSFANARGAATVSAARALVADNDTFIVYASGAETFTAYRRTSSTSQDFLGEYPAINHPAFKSTLFGAQMGTQLGGFGDDSGFLRWALLSSGAFGTKEAMIRPNGVDTLVGQIVFNGDPFIELADVFGFVASRPKDQYMPAVTEEADGVLLAMADKFGYSAVELGGAFAATKDKRRTQPRQKSFALPDPSVKFAAHRGAYLFGANAPENSLDAYMLAAVAGFGYVEVDIQKTSDGQFVMLHDSTLDRTCRNASDYSAVTGGVAVGSLTLAQLRANYVLAASKPSHRKPVPTLKEALQLFKTWGLHPLAEIKFSGASNAELQSLLAKFDDVFAPSGYTISSFNGVELDYLRTQNANANLLYFGVFGAESQSEMFAHVATKKPAMLGLDWQTVTPTTVWLSRSFGVDLNVWTVAAADLNAVVDIANSIVTTDQIPPYNPGASVVYAERGLEALLHNGIASNDVLTLAQNQAALFRGNEVLDFGAYYGKFWLKGAATVIGASSFASTAQTFSRDISSADGRYFDFRSLLANKQTHGLRIISGPGGCQISNPYIVVTSFY